jgi:hypothetical protein
MKNLFWQLLPKLKIFFLILPDFAGIHWEENFQMFWYYFDQTLNLNFGVKKKVK